MGRIVISENVSLDGVVQDPAGDAGMDRRAVDPGPKPDTLNDAANPDPPSLLGSRRHFGLPDETAIRLPPRFV